MKVKNFEGRTSNWPPDGCRQLLLNDGRTRSSLHLRARSLLREFHPVAVILEEVPLFGPTLFLDFYVPLHKIAIECHGRQHYEFVPHFHGDRRSFVQSLNRDRVKLDWCELNRITMIILPYNESDDEWRERLRNA